MEDVRGILPEVEGKEERFKARVVPRERRQGRPRQRRVGEPREVRCRRRRGAWRGQEV